MGDNLTFKPAEGEGLKILNSMQGYTFEDRDKIVFRGEIWLADLGKENKEEGEQFGFRPVVIIGNPSGLKHSGIAQVACISASEHRLESNLPTHQHVELKAPSTIMFEQINTISKKRLKKMVGRMSEMEMIEANYRMAVSLGLVNP